MADPRKALKRIRKRANKAALMIDIGPTSDKEWELCATAALLDVPRLVRVVDAVLELHKPIPCTITGRTGVTEGTVCDYCLDPTWPCATVATITRTLEEGETQ